MTTAKIKLLPKSDFAKCAGESPSGDMKCAYRDQCARFVRPADKKRQVWSDFWKAGDDCPQYIGVSVA